MIFSTHLEKFSHKTAKGAGSAAGFIVALASVILWLIGGYFCGFSDEWERALTLYLSIITFFIVFIIQRGQNKEVSAMHAKLNELISATNQADNRIIAVEELSEKELSDVHDAHRKIIADSDAVAAPESEARNMR